MKPVTLLTVVFTLATLIACEDSVGPGGNSPAYVLELVEESFNRRAVSVLDGVLSPDFVFYFDPLDVGHDVGGGFIIPECWGWDEYMQACSNMLEQVYSIDFNVNTTDVGDPEEGATTFEANHVPMRILIMIDSVNGFLAEGFFDFELVYGDSAGYDDWKVTEWRDDTAIERTTGLPSATAPASFGTILASFH
jgi:hypothetical protein